MTKFLIASLLLSVAAATKTTKLVSFDSFGSPSFDHVVDGAPKPEGSIAVQYDPALINVFNGRLDKSIAVENIPLGALSNMEIKESTSAIHITLRESVGPGCNFAFNGLTLTAVSNGDYLFKDTCDPSSSYPLYTGCIERIPVVTTGSLKAVEPTKVTIDAVEYKCADQNSVNIIQITRNQQFEEEKFIGEVNEVSVVTANSRLFNFVYSYPTNIGLNVFSIVNSVPQLFSHNELNGASAVVATNPTSVKIQYVTTKGFLEARFPWILGALVFHVVVVCVMVFFGKKEKDSLLNGDDFEPNTYV